MGQWNGYLARTFYRVKYIRWCTIWCCYGNILGSSRFPLKFKFNRFDLTGPNTWSYLKHIQCSHYTSWSPYWTLRSSQCLVKLKGGNYHSCIIDIWNQVCCHSNIKYTPAALPFWVQQACQVLTRLSNYFQKDILSSVFWTSYRIYAIKRPRRLFKTWPGRTSVCLKPEFNRVPAFINWVQFSVFFFKVELLLSISSSRPDKLSLGLRE